MQILNWIDSRLTRYYHDEMTRRQVVNAYIPAVYIIIFASIWAAIFYFTGAHLLGYLMLAYVLITVVITLTPLLTHSTSTLPLGVLGFTGVLVSVLAHAISGGFTGGMWFLMWVVIFPLAIYLTGGRREAVFVLGIALLGLSAAFLFESRLDPPPPVQKWVLLTFNAYVLFGAILMLFAWSVTLFKQLDRSRNLADNLLLSILPASIAAQLKRNPATIAQGYDEVTVLFADIVNFTTLSAEADPVDVVAFLNTIFSDFDDLAVKHGLEKIKTIGDAYMVAGGLPEPRPDHCEAVVAFAVDMLAACHGRTAWHGEPVQLRVGVNTGSVVAGVIGRHKFIYDLWGDAVNTASRMESNGVPDVIQVTGSVKDRLAGKYMFEARPPMYIKGKGEMVTYLLTTGT